MTNTRVAIRYAEAFMTAAEESGKVDRAAEDLQTLEKTIKESKDFQMFLKSPVINRERKKGLLVELFGKRLSPLTLDFLTVLAEKGREEILHEIIAQFFVLRDDRLGIVPVDIKAAVALSKDQEEKLTRRFEGLTHKKIRLAFSLDKQLKGGFLARIGDTVFDGSVKRQLELLRERFTKGVGAN